MTHPGKNQRHSKRFPHFRLGSHPERCVESSHCGVGLDAVQVKVKNLEPVQAAGSAQSNVGLTLSKAVLERDLNQVKSQSLALGGQEERSKGNNVDFSVDNSGPPSDSLDKGFRLLPLGVPYGW